ncbi:MAG: SDR family oxidoreductase [Roseiflexaceae bacterium]|nr:SDR family oxidoreductase [Roseiflexaceae bacterium]
MNILVTGTDGYIGTAITPMLIARGFDVAGLDTGFYRDGWLYPTRAIYPRLISKDIRHISEDDLRGFDAVVHMAELSNDPLGQLHPEITHRINHQGSVELAKKCKAVGITRFVYTSSCSVYGVGSDDYKTEESDLLPQTAYAECKVLVERDVAKLADDSFSPTFLRNATAYGPSPRMRFDIVLNNLSGLAWTTGEIRMTSDGTPWRPLVHVLDIGEAIACVLNAPRDAIHNQIFNVGDTQHNYRVREIAQIVAEAFPGCVLTLGTGDRDNRSYRVSFDKINTQLPGFHCQRDAAQGAKELRQVFERIGMTKEVFENRSYTRLRQLKHLIATEQLDQDFFWA